MKRYKPCDPNDLHSSASLRVFPTEYEPSPLQFDWRGFFNSYMNYFDLQQLSHHLKVVIDSESENEKLKEASIIIETVIHTLILKYVNSNYHGKYVDQLIIINSFRETIDELKRYTKNIDFLHELRLYRNFITHPKYSANKKKPRTVTSEETIEFLYKLLVDFLENGLHVNVFSNLHNYDYGKPKKLLQFLNGIRPQKIPFEEKLKKWKKNIRKPIDRPDSIKFSGLIHFNKFYWKEISETKKTNEQLLEFYINNNSHSSFLPYIIDNQLHVQRSDRLITDNEIPIDLGDRFKENALGSISSIITINERGGSGKTTFLFQLGKQFYNRYNTFLINDPKNIPYFPEPKGKHSLVLLDNYSKHFNELEAFIVQLSETYYEDGFTLLMTEKISLTSIKRNQFFLEIAPSHIQTIEHCIFFSSSKFYSSLFKRLAAKLNIVDVAQINAFRPNFVKNSNRTTTERIFELLQNLRALDPKRYQFKFDWNIWLSFCDGHPEFKKLEPLYKVVANFNYYDIQPQVALCLEIIGVEISSVEHVDLFKHDLPLQLVEGSNLLVVRNPNVIPFFLSRDDPKGIYKKGLFKNTIERCMTSSMQGHIHFLRNVYRNKFLKHDELLKELIPKEEKLIKVFQEFVKESNLQTSDVPKTYMELYILFSRRKQVNLAVEQLTTIIHNFEDDSLHARNRLVRHYLDHKKPEAAEGIIEKLIDDGYHQLPVLRTYFNYLLKFTNDKTLKFSKMVDLYYRNIDSENLIRSYILNAMANYKGFDIYEREITALYEEIIQLNNRPNWWYKLNFAKYMWSVGNKERLSALIKEVKEYCNSPVVVTHLANWLLDKKDLQEAMRVILNFKKNNPQTFNHVVNSVHAGIFIAHISNDRLDLKQMENLYHQATQLLNENVKQYPDAAPSWHQLFVLNRQMRGHLNDKIYYHRCIEPLKKLFNLNHRSSFTVEGILYHIKITRRYHLLASYAERFASKNFSQKHSYYIALIDSYRFLDSDKYKEIQQDWRTDTNVPRTKKLEETFETVNNSMVSMGNRGIYFNGILTSSDGHQYKLADKVNIYSSVQQSTTPKPVFFSLHSHQRGLLANNIEPFFNETPKNKKELYRLIWSNG